jgi:hypothetical protein
MNSRLTLHETDAHGRQITTDIWPTLLHVVRVTGQPGDDIGACVPAFDSGRIVNVTGDDYGFPGCVLAVLDIEWDNGGPERITVDAVEWDACL